MLCNSSRAKPKLGLVSFVGLSDWLELFAGCVLESTSPEISEVSVVLMDLLEKKYDKIKLEST